MPFCYTITCCCDVSRGRNETGVVVTGNVWLVVPGEMNTDEGTLAAEFRLPSAMVTPPIGAWPLRVTVPVDAVATVNANRHHRNRSQYWWYHGQQRHFRYTITCCCDVSRGR